MEHECELAQRIGKLLFDEKSSDMTFIVEGERVPAHRALFTISCDYFRALLDGNMKESLQNEVVLESVPLRGFKLLMSYVYTGQLGLKEADEESILEVLELSHLWGFETLETELCQYLKENVSIDNVVKIYSKAHALQIGELRETCQSSMIEEPNTILESKNLWYLSEAAFCDMLSWDTFCAKEIDIFKTALRWHLKCQPEEDFSRLLKVIRLSLIDTKDLVTTVQDSGLIPADLLVDVIRQRESRSADLNFRGCLNSCLNLASPDCGALRLTAKDRGNYVTERIYGGYDKQNMPPYPSEFVFRAATGLTIALSGAFFINNIKFRLFGTSGCSYYVEVSMDLVDWVRIIDHTKYNCGCIQDLYFARRAARYIRIIGTWTEKEGNPMRLKSLQITYTTSPFEFSCGFYAPRENVATKALGACVGGTPSPCAALIDENNKGDKGEPLGWTSHEIGKNSISIFLPQPYTVSSMRMLLRNDESRAYRYYVETSLDDETWTRVADHTTDFCRSWQNIVFEARPVLSIRIVGTESTVDKNFSCAFFECPASTTDDAGNLTQGEEGDSTHTNEQHV